MSSSQTMFREIHVGKHGSPPAMSPSSVNVEPSQSPYSHLSTPPIACSPTSPGRFLSPSPHLAGSPTAMMSTSPLFSTSPMFGASPMFSSSPLFSPMANSRPSIAQNVVDNLMFCAQPHLATLQSISPQPVQTNPLVHMPSPYLSSPHLTKIGREISSRKQTTSQVGFNLNDNEMDPADELALMTGGIAMEKSPSPPGPQTASPDVDVIEPASRPRPPSPSHPYPHLVSTTSPQQVTRNRALSESVRTHSTSTSPSYRRHAEAEDSTKKASVPVRFDAMSLEGARQSPAFIKDSPCLGHISENVVSSPLACRVQRVRIKGDNEKSPVSPKSS
eukprot:TRINITY_DN42546_c0_g1_i1.p1 TRINITY_DN42546_c0_g1~~TRINITY_DN42546_c0_g1_i1.p1  ORF type:complete len:332 (-),score=13.16 TRINITY_DN42546_c0_g1_i1:97-1092(-)